MPVLDLEECLYDTPAFRKQIQTHNDSVVEFGECLKQLVLVTQSQLKHSIEYSKQRMDLKSKLESFAELQGDPAVALVLNTFGSSIDQIEKYRNTFNDQINDFCIDPLDTMEKEVDSVKVVRKQFEHASENTKKALQKYMDKKPKDPTIQDTAKELADRRKSFHGDYMKYVAKLNDVEAKKNIDFMENMLRYITVESAFHHLCHQTLEGLVPFIENYTEKIRNSRREYEKEVAKSLDYQQHFKESTAELHDPLQGMLHYTPQPGSTSETTGNPRKAGYLFERGARLLSTEWNRKYYSIKGDELICTSRDPKNDPPQIYNLCVCNAKATDEYERRFCFIVTSPTSKLVLQAENEQDMEEWIQNIREVREIAFNSGEAMSSPRLRRGLSDMAPTATAETENNRDWLQELWKIPGNNRCADCGQSDPDWASTNLGILMCIECSGTHRKLGVHFSKVRSVRLDKWEADVKEIMRRLGNAKVNGIYEENIPAADENTKIHPNSKPTDREAWITRKYSDRSFVEQKEEQTVVNNAFWNAIKESDLAQALRYLAQKADVNFLNNDNQPDDGGEQHEQIDQPQTALQIAVHRHDNVAVEFLLQWSSDVNIQSSKGWTSLHFAAADDNANLLLVLLKRDAKTDIKNDMGLTPLELAMKMKNGQALTALRIFAFDRKHNSSPANSMDFGFREAMSSFKPTFNRNPLQSRFNSKSADDLSQITPIDANPHQSNTSPFLNTDD